MNAKVKITGIIPVRYASTRFPGKALVDIKGKSMIQRVIEQASKAKGLTQLIVATDDARIFDYVQHLGYTVIYTQENHVSGTDRCIEAMEQACPDTDYVINIQGDEPFLNPLQIDELAAACDGIKSVITQVKACHNANDLLQTGEVKVVCNAAGEAMYFSRAVIPAGKSGTIEEWIKNYTYLRHLGLYAYKKEVLKTIGTLPISDLETLESLEQLRWLQAGIKIHCIETQFESHCIDTPEDLQRILNRLQF